MRFKSRVTSGYQVFAVTGTNTVSFAIDASGANIAGLLGFAVERVDPTENERYFVYGFKVFPSVIRQPNATTVKTYDHPIQSFVWDDFTAKDGREYEYLFYPLKGTPKNLDRSAAPISIKVRTEPLFSGGEHDIFFNRGVASSQAYTREFQNVPPDRIESDVERERALDWLSRKLDDAILKFIKNAKHGDTLLGCFYEFHYEPVVREFRAAIERGVNVRLIIDAKVNETTDKDGKFHESFPREANKKMLRKVGIPRANYVLREAKPSNITHNKFMVLLKGQQQHPTEVWTGSTNISMGGIHGQTNVGHWVRDTAIAESFKSYWEVLESDPGPAAGADRSTSTRENKAFRHAVEALEDVPTEIDAIPSGITPIFSPRTGKAVLEMYAKMIDDASSLACITLAFGIGAAFKELLKDNTRASHITFMLLEKEDKPNPRSTKSFIGLSSKHNVYKAWGSYLRDPLYQWAKETNAAHLGLNKHVSYIHSKFLLMDPLGDDPIVVTGSANFSDASTNDNDENMLVIRGNTRVADIYLTEFNRLFFHYYFRSVQEATLRRAPASRPSTAQTLFLDETDGWTANYAPGKLKRKRVELLTTMHGAVVL